MNMQQTMKYKKGKNNEEQWTACYCRLSCDDDLAGDSNSIRNQKMLLQKYADDNRCRNVKFYVDDGYSGTNFNRPDFQRMISDVEEGKINTVIVKDMSRFGRDYIMVGYYTEIYFGNHDVHFIAVNDNVDSSTQTENDLTPFKNVFNEWYAKDTSKKIRSVLKAKGNSGKHVTSLPPLGYKKDPNDKEKWIIDEGGAEIVREIFRLCLHGYGPTQIARILTERNVDTPVIYCKKHGLPIGVKEHDKSHIWCTETIKNILENLEYTGCTVNFKSCSKSYKVKKRIDLPREDWVVFENTQEAIIDKQTFETVQKIRANKRRPTDMGEMSPLSGMLYCADCGKKMYLCRCTTMKQKPYFNCSSYRKYLKRTCTSHQIKVETIEMLISDDLRKIVRYATSQREEFLQTLIKNAEVRTNKEMKNNVRELDNSEERINTLDKIIQSLYEDKVSGKISEERYLKMSDTYEREQATLSERVKVIKTEMERTKEQENHILEFMMLINKYSSFEELTPEILNSLIDKVIVHEKTKVDGHYRQTVEIIYNFVGAIDKPIWKNENN